MENARCIPNIRISGNPDSHLIGMAKGEAMLEVKMQEMFKAAQRRASGREQRNGQLSVAEDLRTIYERARAKAYEKRALMQRISALQAESREDEAEALEDARSRS